MKKVNETWEGFLLVLAFFIFLFGIAGIIFKVLQNWHQRSVKVGDVFAEYYDRRTNEWAISNGFPAESVSVVKVVGISNDRIYVVTFSVDVTETNHYPWPFNMEGPIKNWADAYIQPRVMKLTP